MYFYDIDVANCEVPNMKTILLLINLSRRKISQNCNNNKSMNKNFI